MFHKKEIELYQSITAPVTLKQKVVMTSKKPAKRPWYVRPSKVVTAFASLALVLFTVYLVSFSSPSITLLAEGEPLGKTPIVLSTNTPYTKASNLYMDENSFSTILKIDVSGNTTITVSSGAIYDTENSNDAGQSITVAKDTSLCWTVNSETDSKPYQLTVNDKSTTYTFILEKNNNTGIWTISQQ